MWTSAATANMWRENGQFAAKMGEICIFWCPNEEHICGLLLPKCSKICGQLTLQQHMWTMCGRSASLAHLLKTCM